MSAVASLTVVRSSGIVELARLAPTSSFHAYLTEHGRKPLTEYGWSGYCMLHVLSYLEERGVDLSKSEFDGESATINKVYAFCVLITPAHKRYLDQLVPAGHDREELAAHFDEMGLDLAGSGMAGLDGLKLLRDSISQLQDDEVLLLHIG